MEQGDARQDGEHHPDARASGQAQGGEVLGGGEVGKSSDNWNTPRWLTDALGYFDLDPCSNPGSTVNAGVNVGLEPYHGRYLPQTARGGRYEEHDGLALDWGSRSVFCNPPYSNVMPWAVKLAAHPGPWVALVKLDPTTRWWAKLMEARPAWSTFRKRIRFEGAPTGARFASALFWGNRPGPLRDTDYLWKETP